MNPIKSSEIEIKSKDDFESIRTSQRRLRALEGAVLGTLCGLILFLLGVNELVRKDLFQDIFVVPALVGCALSVSPLRKFFRIMTAGLVCALFIVGYTPLAPRLQLQLLRKDALAKAPAVVVLSTYLQSDGTLNSAAQERVMQGYILLKRNWANRLVLTANATDFGSQAPAIQNQMKNLGLDAFPVDVVGHVRDTHDEALAVAQLAKERSWSHHLSHAPYAYAPSRRSLRESRIASHLFALCGGRIRYVAPHHPKRKVALFSILAARDSRHRHLSDAGMDVKALPALKFFNSCRDSLLQPANSLWKDSSPSSSQLAKRVLHSLN